MSSRTTSVATLTLMERSLLISAVDLYVADLRAACLKDQGTADGRPGTVGRGLQERAAEVRRKLVEGLA